MDEETRKLAHVEIIKEIREHGNAEKLEVAMVLGWQTIVKKDDFHVGDLCVYCEVDSVLPPEPDFVFLKDHNYRIRTIRLRGLVSQGICFPLSILPNDDGYKEGDDVTEQLKITKYIPKVPACLSGEVIGARPDWIPKTDEERIQNVPDVLVRHEGKPFVITEKLDGSSCSIGWKDGDFHVCGRNYDYIEDTKNTYWEIAKLYDIENKMKSLGRNLVIQGEIIGNGIQKNKYKLEGHQIFLFDMFDPDTHQRFTHRELVFYAEKLNIETVPIIDDNFILHYTVDELVELADGKSMLYDCPREGLVFRSPEYVHDEEVGRLSFKVISNKFLLKHEE